MAAHEPRHVPDQRRIDQASPNSLTTPFISPLDSLARQFIRSLRELPRGTTIRGGSPAAPGFALPRRPLPAGCRSRDFCDGYKPAARTGRHDSSDVLAARSVCTGWASAPRNSLIRRFDFPGRRCLWSTSLDLFGCSILYVDGEPAPLIPSAEGWLEIPPRGDVARGKSATMLLQIRIASRGLV
jgi:hypothetical protein